MIFGDSSRELSVASGKPAKERVYGMVLQTDAHIGPGSYVTENADPIKGGWSPKRFSTRQPMTPPMRRDERSYHMTAGVLLPVGIAQAASPHKRDSPGPGHYGASTTQFSPRKSSNQMAMSSTNMGISHLSTNTNGSVSGFSSPMGTSPRLSRKNSVMKNGVVFEGTDTHSKNNGLGPGHYNVPLKDTLLKKSFNARVSSGANKSQSMNGTKSSPKMRNSYGNYSPRLAGNGSRNGSPSSPYHEYPPPPALPMGMSGGTADNAEYSSQLYFDHHYSSSFPTSPPPPGNYTQQFESGEKNANYHYTHNDAEVVTGGGTTDKMADYTVPADNNRKMELSHLSS